MLINIGVCSRLNKKITIQCKIRKAEWLSTGPWREKGFEKEFVLESLVHC